MVLTLHESVMWLNLLYISDTIVYFLFANYDRKL